MTVRQAVPVILATALVTAFAMATLSPARADAPRTAVCKEFNVFNGDEDKMGAWMNQQLAAGHTQFVYAPVVSVARLCAW
jgi:hypothetical protein